MAKAGRWSAKKALGITVISGLGHAVGSIVLGLLGVAFGLNLDMLLGVEGARGDIAAWGLIIVGLLYAAWGIRKAARSQTHDHVHAHADGTLHTHIHDHSSEHLHTHTETANAAEPGKKPRLFTPWAIFIIFVLGPCEPLIPMMMAPAAMGGGFGPAMLVAGVFTVATVATMCAAMLLAYHGLKFVPGDAFRKYSHSFAGGSIAMCGLAIVFLGV